MDVNKTPYSCEQTKFDWDNPSRDLDPLEWENFEIEEDGSDYVFDEYEDIDLVWL